MKRLRLWGGVILLFVSGMVIGGLLTGHYFKSHVSKLMHGGPAGAYKHVTGRLLGDLGLSDEQQAEIDSITTETEDDLYEITRVVGPQIEAVIDAQTERIREILNDEQRDIFDDRVEGMKRRHEEAFRNLKGDRRDHPGPGDPFDRNKRPGDPRRPPDRDDRPASESKDDRSGDTTP